MAEWSAAASGDGYDQETTAMMMVAPVTDKRELSAEEVDIVSGARGCIYNPVADGPFNKWIGERNDWLPGGGMRGPTFSEQVNDWLSSGRGTF